MIEKTWINADIARLVLPYKDIFTSVFLIRTKDGVVLFDTASSAADVEDHILPWLEELGIMDQMVRYLFVSHNHRDHAGGLLQMTATFPEAMIVSGNPDIQDAYGDSVIDPADGEKLLRVLQVIRIPGHTADSMALLDTRTGLLLTGDCLQFSGIFGSGEWGANISFPAEHLQALKRVEKLPVKTMVFAHDYHPVGQTVSGKEHVAAALQACRAPLQQITQILRENPAWSDEQVRAKYETGQTLPKVSLKVVAAMRTGLKQRKIKF